MRLAWAAAIILLPITGVLGPPTGVSAMAPNAPQPRDLPSMELSDDLINHSNAARPVETTPTSKIRPPTRRHRPVERLAAAVVGGIGIVTGYASLTTAMHRSASTAYPCR